MTTVVKTDVVGIKDLQAKFQDMATRVGGAERAEICLRGAEVIAEETRRNIIKRGLIEEGHLLGSVEAFKVNQWTAGVAVGRNSEAAAYAATHEHGLEKQPITAKQRGYFMWRCSAGEDMFCVLANKETYTIPKRPFLRPAVMSAKGDAREKMADHLLSVLREYEE